MSNRFLHGIVSVNPNIQCDSLIPADYYWKDEQISLNGVNPTGPAAAPTADPAGEGWLFAGTSTDNAGVMGRQINHDCVQGEHVVIMPHVHWRKTTDAAGDVVWRLEYKYAKPGGDFGAYIQLGSDQKTPVTALVDNNTAARHLITAFGQLSLSVHLSTKIYFRLTRVASDTVNDTYAADALAMSFDYHYPADSPGSLSEYQK